MNHRKSKQYGLDHNTVADTQRERPPVDPPATVAEFMRALFWAIDEGPTASRGGTRWGTR